jgi:hypothetical protein
MSEVKKNVFKQQAEALLNIADELQTTNAYIYSMAVDLQDLGQTMRDLLVYIQEQGIKVRGK